MRTVINGLNQYVIQFAEKVIKTIEDMTGICYRLKNNPIEEKVFTSGNGMVVFLPFAGTVQGSCILILNEEIAIKLIGVYGDNLSKQKINDFRSETADAIKELMNIALGQLMVQLETDFGDLSYSNAIVTFGDTYFPKVASSSICIEGDPGIIKCIFSLNMVNLKIAKKLKCISDDLTKKKKQIYIDGLTCLYNRLYFNEIFREKLNSSKKCNYNLSILFIDVDYFKQFNDTYGHQIGDLVLVAVSEIIKRIFRTEDIPCRYGGDEIIIMLPDTNIEEAYQAAVRLKKAINKIKLNEFIKSDTELKLKLNVTLSIGITQFKENDTPEQLLSRVDTALYEAKTKGRNKIILLK